MIIELPDGHYKTEAGSTVFISRDGMNTYIEFDWLEEGACIDCEASIEDGMLVWTCDICGGGFSSLEPEAKT